MSMQKQLSAIMQEQHVKSSAEIDPDRASNEQLEALGGVIMNMMNPTQKMREMMDFTMGGSDSPLMKGAKRMLGYRYLNCGPGSMMGLGMMGYGPMCPAMITSGTMMGQNMSTAHPMMHSRHFWVASFFVIWLVIIILVLLVIILAKKAFCKMPQN